MRESERKWKTLSYEFGLISELAYTYFEDKIVDDSIMSDAITKRKKIYNNSYRNLDIKKSVFF